MQNKGFVKVFAFLLTLVCLFYLSFSVVTNHFESKAEAIAQTEGQDAADRYLDSLLNNKVYCNVWTLKECREMGIGLGLDLKGGMNVILEVSVPDVIKALADHKEETDENDGWNAVITSTVSSQTASAPAMTAAPGGGQKCSWKKPDVR